MNFLISDQDFKVNLRSYDINIFPKEETLLSIGNGKLVSRGTNDESNTSFSRETYISGFFDRNRDHEVEELVNVPDVFEYDILINGAKLDFNSTNIYDYDKTLDLKYGFLTRTFMIYHGSLEIFVKSKKYCDMNNRNVAVQEIEYTTNRKCSVTLIDKIDGRLTNQGLEHFVYDEKYVQDNTLNYYTKTMRGQELYISSKMETDYPVIHSYSIKRKLINRETTFELEPLKTINLKKTIEFSMDDFKDCESNIELHKMEWDKIWNQARVKVAGNSEIQKAIDFSTYHLIINSNLDDPSTNLAAKGMTGSGYKGHTFWDTEIFLLPFYISNFPDKAKNLLKYRTYSLKEAQKKAKRYNYSGAMMPWEGTRPDKADATPEYGPINIKTGKVEKIINAEKELHINSAVVYGFELYYNYTNDKEFITEYGAELVVEIAKFWLSRLEYNQESDYYEILDVVGPDEYKEHVDNNMYTNFTAKRSINLVKKWYEEGLILDKHVVDYDFTKAMPIAKKIKIQEPNDKSIIPQDDTYLNLDIIDLQPFKNSSKVAQINKEYSMAEKCKIQVGKQADLLLLFQMYKGIFEDNIIKNNFDYYEDKCLHDSSLSLVTHNIITCDLNEQEFAYEFLKKSLLIDYAGDINSSNEGIHFASMGGHWLSLIRGFLNIYVGDKLEINPKLPSKIDGIAFKMYYFNSLIEIKANKEKVSVINNSTKDIECVIYKQNYIVKGGDRVEISR